MSAPMRVSGGAAELAVGETTEQNHLNAAAADMLAALERSSEYTVPLKLRRIFDAAILKARGP